MPFAVSNTAEYQLREQVASAVPASGEAVVHRVQTLMDQKCMGDEFLAVGVAAKNAFHGYSEN